VTAPLTTVAGVRATLRDAATVIERAGWAQGKRRSLDGRVCALEAIAIAADGDPLAELDALAEVSMRLLPLQKDLAEWNDNPVREQHEVVALLRNTAQRVSA
jgi:hypothetical protein